MKASVKRVHDALVAAGLAPRIVEFDATTRTAEEAARAIGTEVGRIVKSLVFEVGDRVVLVLTSGSNRVDTQRLGGLLGARVRRAHPDVARGTTGFAVGGVPPVGHTGSLPIYVDRDLLQYDLVWAAAGTPNTVFPIEPDALVRVSGGQVADVKQRTKPSAVSVQPGAGVQNRSGASLESE